MIDFEIPGDIKGLRARVAAFVDSQVLPVEPEIGTRPFFDIVKDVQAKARAEAGARANRIVDSPDEVHRWTIGRSVLKAFEKTGSTAAATGGDIF